MSDEKTIIEEEESLKDEEKDFSREGTLAEISKTPEITEDKPAQKRSWLLYISVAILVVALVVVGYLLFIKEKAPDEGANQIRQMQQLAQNIRGLEGEVKKKQNEIFSLMNDYKEKTGEPFIGVNPLNLDEKEQKLLEQKIKEEKDVSIKSLLEEINEKNNDITELQKKIKKTEALLPKPHIVKEGENHYQIAMNFLLKEKKVEKKRAMHMVERTALIDTMVPGFKVWNFYTGDSYGTSVTQGTAPISPNELIRRAKKKLVNARDEAITERDNLAEDIDKLEEKRNELIKQLSLLTNEKENLINKVSELNEHVNSLFYLLDTQRNLKKEGILKGGFLKSTKLRNVPPEYFSTSIDLRSQNEVPISATEMGILKIKSITIFPKFFKKGIDYNVQIDQDKQNAILIILGTAKFKNERVVISVK